MRYIYNILITLSFCFVFCEENWTMTITADDIQGEGASDQIILGMCDGCHDGFHFGEDEYDLPTPPGNYTDISFFNFNWNGTYDDNENYCSEIEFSVDKKDFHLSSDLLIWNIIGDANLNEDINIQLSWGLEELEELPIDYEIFLYIGNSSYNMRNIESVVIAQSQLTVINDGSVFSSNIQVVIGGCAETGNIANYYYDSDADGFGAGIASEFCIDNEPNGWVEDNSDVDDEIYCLSNIIDQCGDCDGEDICVGCSDIMACNYSGLVTIDDGSCYYIEQYYNCDGSCVLDSDGDNVCDELETLGCTDVEACNYDLDATEDDGSCEYPDQYYDCDNNCILDFDNDSVCDELEIDGCTNPESCLFDPLATEYDGSCCSEDDEFCFEAPGQIDNLNIEINLNSATIDWEQPCGISNGWIYRILENLNDAGIVIPSPFTIEDLDWGEDYTYYLKTINSEGNSITEINFTTDNQPLPGEVVIIDYQSGEAQISLDWTPADNTSIYNIVRDDVVIDQVSNEILNYIDDNISYYPELYYVYQIQSVNSQGNLGALSDPVQIQPVPVPSVLNLESYSDPGSITFSWDTPSSYASLSNYSFRLSSDNINTVEIQGNLYTISDLNFEEEVCLSIQAIHEFGESNIETLCAYPTMPYPPPVSDFNAIGNEGYVSIYWTSLDEPNHFVNIYRDQQLIVENLNTIENPPPYINDMFDGYGLLAGQPYSYQIRASNSEFTLGEISNPVIATAFPLPIVSDLSAEAGNGRVILNWTFLSDYAGYGYVYEVIDDSDNVVLQTDNSYATVSSLSSGQEYCFRVRVNSLGGYGISDESESACAIPDDIFDGTADDTDINWGIQLSVDLLRPSGQIISDAQNMLGVAGSATDGCDSDFDIGEAVDPPNNFVKLYFPHQDWTCGLDAGGRYNNDIRSEYNGLNEIKEWDITLTTDIYEQNIATLSFYFYENAGGNTAYYTTDNINYIKINNGDQIDYGLLTPAAEGAFRVIVGNIVPVAPANVSSGSGYREIELSWTDGYIPGTLTYESLSYNIYRNNQLVGNTTELSFIDRGLDFSTVYEYQISGVNIAGEGEKSISINGNTLNNRSPIANAGLDLIIYDTEDDNIESSEFSLPMNSEMDEIVESNLLSLENISWDPDNYSDVGAYDPPLDELSYLWDNFQNSEIYNLQSDGYGLKIFTLEVNDGFADSELKDSAYVKVMPMPMPAKVYVDTSYSGLYSIDIVWLESNYNGEPYIKHDINATNLVFENGDSFEDINGNGVYDPGSDPLPPFYGLSNLNNPTGYKNIAKYYQVEVDGNLINDVAQPCDTNPGDIYLDEYCYSIEGLSPSTEYSILVRSCNFNDECNNSETINIRTGDSPSAEVIYPNGAEIVGIDEDLNIQLDFGPGARYVDSLVLSILIDEESIWDTTIFTSTTQNIIDSNYLLPINNLDYNSTLNPNSKIEIKIVDEGGVNYLADSNYYDLSDNAFIITSNNISHSFDAGWHLIGTPVLLDSNITFQSYLNEGIDFNGSVYWQAIDEYENLASPSLQDIEIFESGKGYYLKLYAQGNDNFSQLLNLSGNVLTEYTIDNLHVGWNLISNPLVISMNINNINIIDGNGTIMNWEQANSNRLISPYLLELSHGNNTLFPPDLIDNTLTPSYEVEPYKGYWVYLYEEVDINFESKVQEENDLEDNLLETDFIINLSSRAFNQTSTSFGDFIQLGYGLDASNEFVEGVDIPRLGFQYFSEYTSMYINHSEDEEWNSEHNQLHRDIREHYQPNYTWDIVGVAQAITDEENPDSEIELFWTISEIDSNYVVILEYGQNFENQTNMKEFDYVKLNSTQFSNMRVTVNLQNYFTGCSEINSCNYFCMERPWDCPEGNLPTNFVDNDSCDISSCVGCMDFQASNYNPNATIDSICDGGENNGLNCMNDNDICGDEGICIEQNCEYNESYLFPLADQVIYVENNILNTIPIQLNNYNNTPVYGVEIELLFDSSIINISSLNFSNSIIDDYTKLYYVNNDTLHFVAYSGTPILSSGLLFELEVNAIGQIGDIGSIVFTKSVLNDEEIFSNALNIILSEGLFEVSGNIGYYSNSNVQVEAADFNLIGYSDYNNPYNFSIVDTVYASSSNLGDYSFNSSLKGSYVVQASKFEASGSDDGLSAVDASRIARYLIDLIDFDENQLLAADVDMNGQVSAVDAALVARYLIGLIDEFNDSSQHWRFKPSDDFFFNITDNLNYEIDIYDLRPLDSNLENQDIIGIRIGDVDGSWISDVQARKSVDSEHVNMHVDPDELLSVPLAITREEAIEGVELVINYDSENLFFNNFELSDDLSAYNIVVNDLFPGQLALIIYSGYEIQNINESFGKISFNVLNNKISNSIITLDKILINGKDLDSGFLVFDDIKNEYTYSRQLSVSANPYPEEFKLEECYPNPFNPSTQIPFSIPIESNVNIAIYDISGRFVSTIMTNNLSAGNYIAKFNGSNLASGVYIVKMHANSLVDNKSFSQSNKVLLLK